MTSGARTIPDEKRVRRRELLAQRRSLPRTEVIAASSRIVATLRELPELREAGTVLLYAADPDETDLSPLLDVPPPGWSVLLPRVEDDGLVIVPYAPGDGLVAGTLGVREPTGAALAPSSVAGPGACTVDVVIVPGVAFDPEGGRLGRGRGMYDRLLAGMPDAVRIGVCDERFVIDDLPLEQHDIRMDLVITDKAVRRGPAVG
jgi:5-formyltetrahydrofolate cyclo-ligase